MEPHLIEEEPLRALAESSHWTSRIGLGRGILVRMVAGQGAIGLLVLTAALVSVWQLSIYNRARRVWMETQKRVSLISTAQQGSVELVLITHRVAFTQAADPGSSEIDDREPTYSIKVSLDQLNGYRTLLEEKATSLPANSQGRSRLLRAVGLIDELTAMASETIETIGDGKSEEQWAAARRLIGQTPDTSYVPHFDRLKIDLEEELEQASIWTAVDSYNAEEAMDEAARTAIGVTAGVAVTVIALGVLLSLNTIRSITDPVNELSEAASKLASGMFDVRVPASRQDEFGHLAAVFNDMASELGKINAGKDQKIHELLIVIDKEKEDDIVGEFFEWDVFQRIREEAAKIRRDMNQE